MHKGLTSPSMPPCLWFESPGADLDPDPSIQRLTEAAASLAHGGKMDVADD